MYNYDRNTPYGQIVLPGDPRRSPNPVRRIAAYVNWEIPLGFAVVLGFLVYVLLQDTEQWRGIGTFAFVIIGWIFSLCLHEFAHATVAFLGGDRSDSTASYLTFNPLKYLNPLLSIILPLVFIILGGIALPGGAVYIHPELIRTRAWRSAMALAGPLMNVICLLLLAIPFFFGITDSHPTLAGALGILAFFQTLAIVLNLLPLPPLDGFQAIAPWLPRDLRATLYSLGWYPLLIFYVGLSYFPRLASMFFTPIFIVLIRLHIDPYTVLQLIGFPNFYFWKH
jgi:Zn-dependent protease